MLSTRRLLCPLVALAGLAAALPAAENYCKPRTICVDGLNKCGVRWGG